MSKETILAVGAAGKFAGLVVTALAERDVRVRGLARNEEKAARAKELGADEVAIGDLADPASLDRALDGVTAVFHIGPAFAENGPTLGRNIVEAAKRNGVRKFVYSSVIHPTIGAMQNHKDVQPVEEAVLESGMIFTILQPAVFFQNLDSAWSKVVESKVLAEPYSTETRFARVDYRDVAEVAAIALTEERLDFGTFELASAGHYNRVDIAQMISEVLGHMIKADRLDAKQLPAVSSGMLTMFDWMDNHSLYSNPLVLKAVLGHEPRTLGNYIAELAARFAQVPA